MKSFASIPIFLTALALLLLLAACTTERKAVAYFNRHELAAADYCAAKFPPKDSIVTRIDTFVKANNPDYTKTIDSLNNALGAIAEGAAADSMLASTSLKDCQKVVQKQATTIKGLRRLLADIKDEYRPCQPDTVIKTSVHYVPNTAKEKSLELQLQETARQTEKYKGKYGFWLKASLVGWGLLLLLVALIFFRSRIPFKLW